MLKKNPILKNKPVYKELIQDKDKTFFLILKNNVAAPDTLSEVLLETEEGRDSTLNTLYWVIKGRRNNKA